MGWVSLACFLLAAMSAFGSDPPKPPPPQPPPDTGAADAAAAAERQKSLRRRGRNANVLTSPTGADPKLGGEQGTLGSSPSPLAIAPEQYRDRNMRL